MKNIFLLILFSFFLFTTESFSKKSDIDFSIKVQKFYDDLMDLASYGKKREFYENYIDSRELSYEEFSKIVDDSDIKIEGSYKSKLISWEKKGNEIEIYLKLAFKNIRKLQSFEKNVKLELKKKEESLIFTKKELLKIYSVKRSKKK